MTKQSRWIMLLSMLICLCMLFASCGRNRSDADASDNTDASVPTDTQETPNEEDEEETEEEWIPDNQTVIYRAIVEEWGKYLTYKTPEPEKSLTATPIFEEREGVKVQVYGTFTRVTEIEKIEGESLENHKITFYHTQTGKAVTPTYETSNAPDAAVYSCWSFDTVIAVAKCTPRVTRETPAWNYVEVYDYYDAEGTKLNQEPKNEMDITEVEKNGYTYVFVEDLCYVSKNGELVHIFPRGSEREFPALDRVYGDYGYVFGEKSVYILGKNAEILASYALNASFPRNQIEFTVLSDGSLLIQYLWVCSDGEESYTVKDAYGNKYILSNVILDVTSGRATEAPAQFLIHRLVTNADDDGMGLSVKDDCQYAEIMKIQNRELVGNAIPVILDRELKIVKELPLILKNQESLVRAVSDRFWILRVSAVQSVYPYTPVTYYYSVDLNVGTVSLYADLDAGEYERVLGGFLFKDALYNDMMMKQMDLSDVQSYQVLDDGKILVETVTEERTVIKTLAWVENHQLKTQVLCDGNDYVSVWYNVGSAFFVNVCEPDNQIVRQELRNANGELLFSGKNIWVIQNLKDWYVIRCIRDEATVYYIVR